LFRQFERDLLPMCEAEGLATLCYNPLAAGLLTGKHRFADGPSEATRFAHGRGAGMYRERYWQAREFETVQAFVALAAEAGIPPAQLALAWVLAQPGVSCAIIGASRPEQLADAWAAAGLRLDANLCQRLDELTREFRTGDASR